MLPHALEKTRAPSIRGPFLSVQPLAIPHFDLCPRHTGFLVVSKRGFCLYCSVGLEYSPLRAACQAYLKAHSALTPWPPAAFDPSLYVVQPSLAMAVVSML